MAANKFATMVHRNTNKMTLILVYVILEWTLIVLLLLNSLFSYLILKFADYFGLKRPCLWCSRLDHLFESNASHRDLVCEAHAKEISGLSYCLSHRRLAESRDMCEDCSPSSDAGEWPKKFAFFPWMKQIGVIKEGCDNDDDHDENDHDYDSVKVVEEDEQEENSKCCCCGVGLTSRRLYPPCILIKPSSWGVLDYAQKKGIDLDDDDDVDDQTFEADHSDHSRSVSVVVHRGDEQGIEENREIPMASGLVEGDDVRREVETEEDSQILEKVEVEKEEEERIQEEEFCVSKESDQTCDKSKAEENGSRDTSTETPFQHLEFYIGKEDCTLIPVDLKESTEMDKEEETGSLGNQDVILDFDMEMEAQVELVTESWHHSGDTFELVSLHKGEDATELEAVESVESSEIRNIVECPRLYVSQGTQTLLDDENGDYDDGKALERLESDLDAQQGSDDDIHMQSDEIDGEISIGTEIPDHEHIDELENEEAQTSYTCVLEDSSTSSNNLHIYDNHVLNFEQAEEEVLEFKPPFVRTNEREMDNHLAYDSEPNEIEEEKVPDTPNSIDSLHQLHKKLLLLERKELGAEDSLDGSVMSDIDGVEGIQAVEKLKSALKAERKALSALYMELEEERSASEVAASHTMAMINRLQEEKAAMQMEALQYQRMMEEQSEYDQEALQLLNELMIKREREKQELEKEFELYRKKVQDYEAKERMVLVRRSRNSSASCSNTEDSDGQSVDLNTEAKEEELRAEGGEEISNQNTPAEAVHYLEESLTGFEEERLSILDQLRVLEEKLFTLSDGEEENHFVDIKPIEHLYRENGNGYHEDSEANGFSNGHSKETNGEDDHYQDRRIMGAKAKRLLPYFDATEEEEAENGVSNQNGEVYDYVTMQDSSVIEFEQDGKRLTMEEEVDHVYERLQALEADREFLKHCMSSLRKGDKGLCLLQEILQHLRDLRSMEHSVRNMGNGVL